jgi:precorrin-4/cobalt-precorrin-4 C11-methyltransferase
MSDEHKAGRLSIVGAGPGKPDLITVRGKRAIDEADVVFATTNGVPVDPGFFLDMKPNAEVVDATPLDVEVYYRMVIDAVRSGKKVVRLQPGDPTLFGSLAKQLNRFEQEGISVEVIPGVPVAFAAACALKFDLTLPGLSEAVVLTRREGRIPVPAHQKLAALAEHRPTFILYLSATLIAQVVGDLASTLPDATPVIVAHKVGWPGELVVRGTLADITDRVRDAGIFSQAVIMIGEVFGDGVRQTVPPERFW